MKEALIAIATLIGIIALVFGFSWIEKTAEQSRTLKAQQDGFCAGKGFDMVIRRAGDDRFYCVDDASISWYSISNSNE